MIIFSCDGIEFKFFWSCVDDIIVSFVVLVNGSEVCGEEFVIKERFWGDG